MTLLDRIRASLARDRDLPPGALALKGVRYVMALAGAPVYLRAATRLGSRVRTIGRPLVENRGRLLIGDDCVFNSSMAPVELLAGEGASLEIGPGALVNFGALIAARGRVTIGRNVAVGPWSIIADTELPDEDGAKPIELGDDVWLAGRVTVLPGSRIGSGSVIAAGAVVSGEIPPGVLAGGAPARVLRRLE